jgi:hypothetical protein
MLGFRSVMDSSAGRDDHQEHIGLDVEAATGDTSMTDLIWVPGDGSSTGNVTGGRKLARHDSYGVPYGRSLVPCVPTWHTAAGSRFGYGRLVPQVAPAPADQRSIA